MDKRTNNISHPELICSLIILMLSPYFCMAQNYGANIRLDAGIDRHYYSFKDSRFHSEQQTGSTINLAYDYFFQPSLALTSGLGITNHNGSNTVDGLFEYDAIDIDGNNYIHKVHYTDMRTNYKTVALEIPLGVRYETSQHKLISDKAPLIFALNAGIKTALILSTKSLQNSGLVQSSGYYPQWDLEITNLPQHNFDTYYPTQQPKLILNNSIIAYSEISSIIALENNHEVYISLYFNYGINNSIESTNSSLINSSGQTSSLSYSEINPKAHIINFGIKLGSIVKL